MDCRIANAVRCVPPQNKPEPSEIKTCRQFLIRQLETLPNVKVILALGKIAHDSVCDALGVAQSDASLQAWRGVTRSASSR